MAKGNFLMGNASGKLGEIVFYRADGEQRARTYLRKFRNPQTVAQQTQRMKFRSSGLSYRLFKRSVIATQKKEKQSFFNAYMSKNIDIAPFLSREDSIYWDSIGASPVAPWTLTQGPLVTPPALHPFNVSITGSANGIRRVTFLDSGDFETYLVDQLISSGLVDLTRCDSDIVSVPAKVIFQALAGAPNCHLVFCFASGITENSRNSNLSPSTMQCFEGGSLRIVEFTSETFPQNIEWDINVSDPQNIYAQSDHFEFISNGIKIVLDNEQDQGFCVETTYPVPSGCGFAVWVASDTDGRKTSVGQLQLDSVASTFYNRFTQLGTSDYQACVDSWIKGDSGADNNVYTS